MSDKTVLLSDMFALLHSMGILTFKKREKNLIVLFPFMHPHPTPPHPTPFFQQEKKMQNTQF